VNSTNDSANEILGRIGEGRFDLENGVWKNISGEAKNIVSKMLEMDPTRRPTATQVIRKFPLSKIILLIPNKLGFPCGSLVGN